jgi:hypothetical protein
MRKLGAVLSVSIAVFAAVSARGQGTSNTFPDPLTSRQLDQFAERLGLDAVGRLELDPFHENYREQFRTLRDGRIEDYLKAGGGGGMGMFGRQRDRSEIESRIKERKEILKAIERLDNQLLDQIQAHVDEAQQPNMASVKLAAERARAKGTVGGMFLGNADIDLAELLRKLPPEMIESMDEAATAEVQSAAREYEQKLTRLMSELADESIATPLAVHDAMAASGVTRPEFKPDALPEPGAMDAYFEASSAARATAMKKQTKLRQDLAMLHHSFLRKLKPSLPDVAYREVRHQFYKRSYNEAWPDPKSVEPMFEQAIALESISADEKAAITAARDSWRSSNDAVTGELVDAVDDFRKEWTFFSFDDSKWSDYQDRMKALHAKRDSVDEAGEQALRAIVGERLAAKRDDGGSGRIGFPGGFAVEGLEISGEEGVMIFDGPGGEGGAIVLNMGGDFGSVGEVDAGDAYLPGPISAKELNDAVERMQLTQDQKTIAEVLHQDYQAGFRQILESDSALVQANAHRVFDPAAGEKFTPPDAQDIEKKYAARKAAFERIKRLDQEFFDGIAPLLSGAAQMEGLEKSKLARQRRVYNRSRGHSGMLMTMGPAGPGSSKESSVDLVDVANALELTSEGTAAANAVLTTYEPAFIDALRRRYETVIEEQKKIDIFHAKMMIPSDAGEVRVEIDGNTDEFKTMQISQKRIGDAESAIASLNRRTVEDGLSKLEESDAKALKRGWQRAAYPSVFRDPRDAEPILIDAIKLEDTSPEQIQQLNEILQKHREEYEKISETMVQTVAASGAAPPEAGEFNPDHFKAMQATQNTMKKLRFDRTELNASSLRKLKAVLSPEQAERLPGLKEKKDQPEGGAIFFSR